MNALPLIAAILFGLALIHTFSAKQFERWSHRYPRHAGLLHLLGEVEVVFGFWAFILIVIMACMVGPSAAIDYVETRQYTEPLFVFVVMVVAASRPILEMVRRAVLHIAEHVPGRGAVTQVWLGLAVIPLAGSLITEPAAMTLAALLLAPLAFGAGMPEWKKYAVLGTLFVNVSIGGTLTSFAAPPVLMVANAWQWDSLFMLTHFGWKAAIAVIFNASAVTVLLRRHLQQNIPQPRIKDAEAVPLAVTVVHVLLLVGIVLMAHHPAIFLGLFLLFLGYTQAYPQHQSPLILKEGLLVGFFLAGLVVLGGMQQWWLQPLVSSLSPKALFFGATALTAITDNAALTYLGSLIEGLSTEARYMLVAGAVAGGGLTVIANAPNPAGVALLKHGFREHSIGAGPLLLGALLPTLIAMALLYWT